MQPKKNSAEVKEKQRSAGPRTVDFDRVLACAPINADAARVVSKNGEHFTSTYIRKDMALFNVMPLLPPMPENATDLRGTKFGRLTVVGYFGPKKANKGPLWLVRCYCGMFTTRHSKAILSQANAEDRCEHCRATFILREGRYPGASGSDMPAITGGTP